jgi:ornithine carbamoyltransferase
MKHLTSIAPLSKADIEKIFALCAKMKKAQKAGKPDLCLKNKTLGMIFEKPSMRTRVSFEVGMTQMGGHAIFLGPESFAFGKREAVNDVALVLSRYLDGIMVRTFAHKNVLDLAKYATIPVINGLCDWEHPCQALADIFTMQEHFGSKLKGRKLVFAGDGNNVARSLALTCAKLDMVFVHTGPKGYDLTKDFMDLIPKDKRHLVSTGVRDAKAAVKGADVIYTDVWASMGQESSAAQRAKEFRPYQVNMALVKAAGSQVKVMHCLPAHRGDEITSEVVDSKYAIVYDEAENRLHVQKAVMKLLMA